MRITPPELGLYFSFAETGSDRGGGYLGNIYFYRVRSGKVRSSQVRSGYDLCLVCLHFGYKDFIARLSYQNKELIAQPFMYRAVFTM